MIDMNARDGDLRQILSKGRREIQQDVRRLRGSRMDGLREGSDDLEHSEADTQDNIELTLLQMRAESLAGIGEALIGFDAGKYGFCAVCSGKIAARRMKALRFAVRCQTCQAAHEREQGRLRQAGQRREGRS